MPKLPNDNDYVFIPTENNYRWVIVLMSFINLFMADGILHSFGIFLKPLSIEYNKDVNIISITHALLVGVYLLIKPFAYALINRFGFQIIGVVGGLLCILGYILPYLCSHFAILIFAMGCCVAIGTSIVCATSIIVVNFYFEKKRAVAAGLSSSGSSFGTIFFPTALSQMEISYGIKKTLLFVGILMIIPVLASLFYLPLTPARVLTDIDLEVALVKDCILRSVEHKHRRKKNTFKFGYTFCCCNHSRPMVNRSFPTIADLVSPERRHVPNLASYIYDPNVLTAHSKRKGWSFFIKSLMLCYLPRGVLGRPLYRDDIFYGGSLNSMPVYKKNVPNKDQMIKSAFYHMAVTRASERDEYVDDILHGKLKHTKAFMRPIRSLLDISLMTNCSFNIYLLCVFTFYGAFAIPLTYVHDRASINGVAKEICPWLVSTLGMGWTVGRISAIGLATVKKVNYKFYCSFLFLVGGVIIFLSGTEIMMKPSRQFMCCFLFGFCCTTMVLMSSVLIEFYGLKNYSNAYGLSIVAMGIGTVIALIVGGFLHKIHGDYVWSFYLSGGCMFVSSFCMLLLGFISLYKKKKKRKKRAKQQAGIR